MNCNYLRVPLLLLLISHPILSHIENPLKSTRKKENCPNSLFENIISPKGYPIESYEVETADKRLLKLFRIQAKGTNISNNKKVIFLQHGLIDSADNWVINGDKNSLGLVLANLGFDVWIGNSRGNKYSLETSDPGITDQDFWNFSFQEMALYDIPANIKFVLEKTNQEKLTWIGHSQGTTQMFAALSDPKTSDYVNNHIEKFIALGPVVFLANQRSNLLGDLAKIPGFEELSKLFKIYDIFPGPCSETSAQAKFQSAVCKLAQSFCSALLSVADANPVYDNTNELNYFSKHYPSGDSVKCILHFKQYVKMDKENPVFQKYDYGVIKNFLEYGQKNPPIYDLGKIKVPVSLHVGLEDKLANVDDNRILRERLRKEGIDFRYYEYENCGHATFLWGKNPTGIFEDVVKEVNGL